MKEKRIYVVCAECPVTGTLTEFPISEVEKWDDEKFMDVAEEQGWVWSSIEDYAMTWNMSYMPHPNQSMMRIL